MTCNHQGGTLPSPVSQQSCVNLPPLRVPRARSGATACTAVEIAQ